MILQDILAQNPATTYERLKSSLSGMGVATDTYESMEIEQLEEALHEISKKRKAMLRSLSYDAEGRDRAYGSVVLEMAAIKSLLDGRVVEASERKLVVGQTYYRGIKRLGSNRISGFRTTYLGEGRCAAWTRFSADVRVLKAVEVMRHGSDPDFAKLYFIMADGRPTSATRDVTLQHVTESSEDARREFGRYCDKRWEGPWPWEAPAPIELRRVMEMNDRNRRLLMARSTFNRKLRTVLEGEVEKSEVIVTGREMTDKITSMIHDLAKLSAELMAEFKDKVRTVYGDQSISGLNDIYTDKINNAVDVLSDLKSSVDKYVQNLDAGGAGLDAGGMGDDAGGTVADMGMGDDMGQAGGPMASSSDDGDDGGSDGMSLGGQDDDGGDDDGDLSGLDGIGKERDKKGKK